MKNLLVLILTSVSVGRCSFSDTPSDEDSFNTLVVTRFDGLEKLYVEFFRRSSTHTPPSVSSRESSPRSNGLGPSFNFRKPASTKSVNYRVLGLHFCRRLSNTSFFQMKRESYVDLSAQETIEELRVYHPEIFGGMYEPHPTSSGSAFGSRSAYTLKDSYRVLPVHVNGVAIMSKVFRCLVRDDRTRMIKQYLVSEEYSTSTHAEAFTESFSIRFLFSYDRARTLLVDGLIENPAWNTIDEYDIERTYTNQVALKKPFRKLLCKLNKSDKLRLCASVMNSVRYRGKIFFQPTPNNVRQRCVKRAISFLNYDIADGIHKEWMISCRGKSREAGVPLTYFLCLDGYTADTVYVLRKEADEKFYLDHYAQIIPVLMEKVSADSWFFTSS